MYKALLRVRNTSAHQLNQDKNISVIIAFRNESACLEKCLKSLIQQNYKRDKFEIILCNDHSFDDSLQIAEHFKSNHPDFKIDILNNSENEFGKKQAIKNAVAKSQFDILAFTDADCVVGNNWLSTISSVFENKSHLQMLCGPVVFIKRKDILEKLFSLEFASLIGVTAASIQNHFPFICNAANMAVQKKTYLNVTTNSNYASGDDVFLLHQIKKQYGTKCIDFNYCKDALVYTHAPFSVAKFIQQRIRWSSKTRGYSDKFALFSAWLVFIVCFTIASGLIISFFYGKLASLFIALFLIKIFVDALLLHQILNLLQRKELLRWIFIEQLLYIFYVPIIALMSLKKTYLWKGRNIS
jgi:cellulose synthase/poly-beta-1,6-N-acetylglucosamine synthase-like glycosyltransferase